MKKHQKILEAKKIIHEIISHSHGDTLYIEGSPFLKKEKRKNLFQQHDDLLRIFTIENHYLGLREKKYLEVQHD